MAKIIANFLKKQNYQENSFILDSLLREMRFNKLLIF